MSLLLGVLFLSSFSFLVFDVFVDSILVIDFSYFVYKNGWLFLLFFFVAPYISFVLCLFPLGVDDDMDIRSVVFFGFFSSFFCDLVLSSWI